VLRRTEVASAITGASRPEQVHANAAAAEVDLPEDVLTAIDFALRRAGDASMTASSLSHRRFTEP